MSQIPLPYELTFHSKCPPLPSLSVVDDSLLERTWKLVPSRSRLAIYKLFRFVGSKLWPPESLIGMGKQRLPFNMFCKFGGRIDQNEVLCTMFVAENTTIPIPRIIDAIDDDGQLFVVMTKVPGISAQLAFSELDEAGMKLFEHDLHDWIHQLRSLRPPCPVVGGLLGTQSVQPLFFETPIGPFDDVVALHQFLMTLCPDGKGSPHYEEFRSRARAGTFHRAHKLCFTHGDLKPHNLLMHNGRLSGMVDFGNSGWFPEYWDYACTTFVAPLWWEELWARMFPQYVEDVGTMICLLNAICMI